MNRWELTRVVAIYLAIALATFGVWAFDSGLALADFIAITVWHFGNGDAWIWADNRVARPLLGLGRGLLVMCAPLALNSAQTRELLGQNAIQISVGYLVLVSAVTSPHAALIFWLEQHERI